LRLVQLALVDLVEATQRLSQSLNLILTRRKMMEKRRKRRRKEVKRRKRLIEVGNLVDLGKLDWGLLKIQAGVRGQSFFHLFLPL
jgi:hypothetical protein